jgi:hypothetical protein
MTPLLELSRLIPDSFDIFGATNEFFLTETMGLRQRSPVANGTNLLVNCFSKASRSLMPPISLIIARYTCVRSYIPPLDECLE